MRTIGRALALLVCVCVSAAAGDKEAQEALNKAQQAWRDGQEPAAVLKLFDEAEGHKPDSRVLRYFIKLNRAQFTQAKLGELEECLKIYDQIIAELVNLPESEGQLRQIKSQAMANKANLLYSEKQDEEGAFQLYKSAAMLYPSARISETASQFMFRLGRDRSRRTPAKRREILELGLKLAEEALKFAPQEFPDAGQRAAWVAKFQLQVALMQRAMSESGFESLAAENLPPASLYQQALWQALQGQADQALESLRAFMKTRPEGPSGLKARNQLRKFIRDEPDFKPLLAREGWKALVTDEAE